MHRVLFAVYKRQDLSFDQFLAHYREVHVPIARRFPKLRQYEIFPLLSAASSPDGPHAFAVMTFDDPADFEAAVASPEFAEAVADNETFVERFETYIVDHIPVVGN
jgi:uncharacterized protein (TIGR02118 family)